VHSEFRVSRLGLGARGVKAADNCRVGPFGKLKDRKTFSGSLRDTGSVCELLKNGVLSLRSRKQEPMRAARAGDGGPVLFSKAPL